MILSVPAPSSELLSLGLFVCGVGSSRISMLETRKYRWLGSNSLSQSSLCQGHQLREVNTVAKEYPDRPGVRLTRFSRWGSHADLCGD